MDDLLTRLNKLKNAAPEIDEAITALKAAQKMTELMEAIDWNHVTGDGVLRVGFYSSGVRMAMGLPFFAKDRSLTGNNDFTDFPLTGNAARHLVSVEQRTGSKN